MKQYTHIIGNVRRIQRVLMHKRDELSELGFKNHMTKDDRIILEVEKTNIKTLKRLIEIFGITLRFWEIKHHFPKGLVYTASMEYKIINSEESLSGL